MKRLLGCLATFLLTSVSASSLISCQQKYLFDTKIWVITDGGTISDMSFNQSAWEGASDYVVSQHDPNNVEHWQKSNWRSAYFESASSAPSDIIEGYKTASYVGAKTLILPGFNHGPDLSSAVKYADNLIYIDGSKTQAPTDQDKIIGVVYYAEMSGFLAGLAAAIYANAELIHPQNNVFNFGTFGGQDNFTAVSDYMWGFLVGGDVFNLIVSDSHQANLQKLLNKPKASGTTCTLQDPSGCSPNSIYYQLNQVAKSYGHNLPSNLSMATVHKAQNVNNSSESWFTNSFEQGNGIQIAKQLLTNYNCNIIFPVAGPQIQDVIAQIGALGKNNSKLVGVDTDQRLMYGDIVITSALKQIANATKDCLYNINHNGGTWKNTDQTSTSHPSWVGIAPGNEKNDWHGLVTKQEEGITKTGDVTPYESLALVASKFIRKVASAYPQSNIPFDKVLSSTFDNNGKLKQSLIDEFENAIASMKGNY